MHARSFALCATFIGMVSGVSSVCVHGDRSIVRMLRAYGYDATGSDMQTDQDAAIVCRISPDSIRKAYWQIARGGAMMVVYGRDRDSEDRHIESSGFEYIGYTDNIGLYAKV